MKKNYFIYLLFLCFIYSDLFAQQSKKNFKLEVTVSDEKEGLLFLKNLTKPLPDSLFIKNGKATISGTVTEPTPFILADANNKYQLFFIGPDEQLKISIKKKEMIVTNLEGSPSHEIFRGLIRVQEPLQQIGGSLQAAYKEPNANIDSLNIAMEKVNAKLKKNFYDFLKINSSSEVAAFVIYSAINNDKNVQTKTADSMYSILTGKAKTCFYGNEMNKMLKKLRAIEVGYNAPDFTIADSTGKKNHTLADFKGKYVLVDFWASWCGPCKAEIPYLKTAYDKFHKKGFEIISVSLDDKKEKWTAALRQYQMPWIHISELKGFGGKINELYHIPGIPKTLLLDKTGKIIAADLRGESLENKLTEILGK